MTRYEKEIEALSWTVEDLDFKKISRFYLGISKHPEETNVAKTYLTKESINDNCKTYFGHKCDFFSQRLYAVLSGNIDMSRITFVSLIEKFYNIFVKSDNSYRMRSGFIFQMLDFN